MPVTNWVTDARKDLCSLVAEALPNATKIYNNEQGVRLTWKALLQEFEETGNGLQPPWALIEWGELERDDENSADNAHAYLWPVVIYLCVSTKDAGGVAKSMSELNAEIEAAVKSILDNLRSDGYESFTSVEESASYGQSNVANEYFALYNHPLWGCAVDATLLVGERP